MARKNRYDFRYFEPDKAAAYIRDIVEIFNAVWSDFLEDYTPLNYDDIAVIFKQAKPVIEDAYIWFAYDKEKPIGMIVGFPDVNQIIKGFKGKMHLLNKLRFLWRKKSIAYDRVRFL